MATDAPLGPMERKALEVIRRAVRSDGRAPSVRALMSALGYRSPRSSALLIDRLIQLGYLERRRDRTLRLVRHLGLTEGTESTVDVPVVGSAPCGLPLLAEANTEAVVAVSDKLADPRRQYFILRARGDSMSERGIPDGGLVLVRAQQTADSGDIVVALVDDEVTIKELACSEDAVALLPRSSNPSHRPIVLRRDFRVQGVVVAVIPQLDI